MKKAVIIGAGFSGLTCARRLSKFRRVLEIILIDRKETSDFLPTLPDCLGRGISPLTLSYRIESEARKRKIQFLCEEVISVDLDKRQVLTSKGTLDYDYLVIASGSETNFYGNENIRTNACKLDSVADASGICAKIKKREFDNFIIGGGGYTGIEVATNLAVYLGKNRKDKKVVIVERAPSVLGPLPEWMKKYTFDNLEKLRIDVFTNSQIEKIEGDRVQVSGGRVFDNALAVWTAGVKTPGFIQGLDVEKNPQGRIKVDEFLRLKDNCFVIGDAAYFSFKDIFLRMAVQFAIAQGDCAARNIIRSIKGRNLREYRPIDFGYIIPMANNSSCGEVLGVKLKGRLPTALHFLMCVYRSVGLKNKSGIISGLLKKKHNFSGNKVLDI